MCGGEWRECGLLVGEWPAKEERDGAGGDTGVEAYLLDNRKKTMMRTFRGKWTGGCFEVVF